MTAEPGDVVGYIRIVTQRNTLFSMTPIPLIYEGKVNGKPVWYTGGDINYYDYTLDYTFRIPAGYRFDLATIPRQVWWFIAPFELSTLAPLLHDFVYEAKGILPGGRAFTRLETDELFRRVMALEGISFLKRSAAFAATRAFGWTFWNTHKKLPREG